jgi:hypothetical protein
MIGRKNPKNMEKKTSKSEGVATLATKTKPKTAAPRRKAAASNGATPTAKGTRAKRAIRTEDIALRAYFIAEKRHSSGTPGDELGDWVEAERQLLSEQAGA